MKFPIRVLFLPFVAVFGTIAFVAVFWTIALAILVSILETGSTEGVGNAGDNLSCSKRSEEKWAEFFDSEEEGTTFYKKINDLALEHPGIDITLVTSIIRYGDEINVDKDYKCNNEVVDEETGEVKKEACSETTGKSEKTAENAKELYKEAEKVVSGMLDGSVVKTDEEIKLWLKEDYLEDRLTELGMELPTSKSAREKTLERAIEDIYYNKQMYEELVCEEDSSDAGSCKFQLKNETISNVKVKLYGCTTDGGNSGPLENEELVDLEKYILGVTYTENGGAPDEAVKMQAIAARSYLLTRNDPSKFEITNGSSIVPIRNCTWDQAYCNPDKGCWSDSPGGEGGYSIHSGQDTSKTWSKPAIPENSKLRTLVSATAGQVVVDKDGKVLKTPYTSTQQTKWNKMANQGKSVIEMVKATYPNAVEVTSNCTTGGDGSLTGNPNFSNNRAWKWPENVYAKASLYGQCTWFAWGRFYEIYGYSPGFTGDGYQCVDQLIAAHPDKFEKSNKPKVGAIGSSDKAHNHVWIVTGVDGNKITIQEGNLDFVTNDWNGAIKDWRTVTRTLSELKDLYGNIKFANPKKSPQ